MTAEPSRPELVRRYLRRGWWLFAVTTVLTGWVLLVDWAEGDTEVADDVGQARRVEATVEGEDAAGDSVLVRYEHPIFGSTETYLELETAERRFRPDERVEIVASRFDPGEVALLGDTSPRAAPDWAYAVPPLVALLFVLRRRQQVRRAERGMTNTDPPAHYLVQLRRSRWPRRRIVADLYPPEAAVGTFPLCSVPLISSAGLPIGGAAFPVQAWTASPFSASTTVPPGPWRALSLRTDDDELLWPSRRGLGFQFLRRRRFGGRIADPPSPALLQDLPPGRRAKGWWVWCYRSLGLLLPGLAVFGLVFNTTAAGERRAEEFAERGVEVPAEIVEVDESIDRVTISYALPGEERRARVAVPVTFPEDFYVGQERLAVVNRGRGLLVGDLYDTSVPRGLAVFLLLPGLIWAPRELLLLRRLRRLSRGSWYDAEVLYGGRVSIRAPLNAGLKLAVGRPGATAPSCVVVVAVHKAEKELRSLSQQQTYDAPWPQAQLPETGSTTGPQHDATMPFQTFRMAPRNYAGPVLVAGTLAPGQAVVLRIGDVVVPAIRVASAPKQTQPVPPEETRVAALNVPPVPRSV